MPIVADAAVAIRGDLSKFVSDLRPAETSVTSLGAKLKAALSPPGVGGISGDFTNLATALDRAQREADEALIALRALSRADLPEEDARKYADAINDIESEAKVTASELRQLQSAQPEFDTPELRQAAQGLDKVGDEANELGNEFRELARQHPDATLAKAARESKALASGMDKAGKSSTSLMTKLQSVHGLLIGLGLAIGAQQVIGFFNDSIKAASNLNETLAATGQIFGADALSGLERWADTAAEVFGQSQRQALDAANTFATFGKSAGLAGDDLVGFSTSLTELASDLASFKNTTPEEAITAIGAALRGESEPIRRYGVLLDEATLRQQALTLGIIDNIKTALTPQQRVLAAQAEIFAQTADAQGDYARTSEGLANQQRRQAALMEDAMADLGEVLLPLALGFTRFAADTLPDVIKGMKGVLEILIPVGKQFAEHADKILPALALILSVKVLGALVRVATQARITGIAFKSMLGPIGLLIIAAEALTMLTDPLDDWISSLILGQEATKDLATLTELVGDEFKANKIRHQLKDWGISVEDFSRLVEAAGGDVDLALQAIEDASGDASDALLALSGGATTMSTEWAQAWESAADTVRTEGGYIVGGTKKVAEGVESATEGMAPAMARAVEALLAEAKEVPEGVAVTLDNGQTVVAGSAEELAQLLPAAIIQARRDAVIEAYPAPAEIADALLAGKEEFDPVRQMIIDALKNPVSDARSLAQAEALLFDPRLGKALGKTGFSETQAAGVEAAGLLIDSILAAQPDIFDAGAKLPPKIAKGFVSTRGDVIEAIRDLNDDQAMTAGEVAKYLEDAGEEGLAALVRGIRSKKPDVEAAQLDMNDAAIRKAALLGDPMFRSGFTAGGEFGDGINSPDNRKDAGDAAGALGSAALARLNQIDGKAAGDRLARTFAEGIDGGAWNAVQAAARLASGVAGFLPSSEPKNPKSALRGITTMGGNLVEMIASGIYGQLRVAQRATNALSASLVPDLVAGGSLGRMPTVPASAFASAAGGGDNINVYLPGRTRLATGSEIGDDLRVLGEQGQLKPKRKVPND